MKQILTLLAATFILTASYAEVKPVKSSINIKATKTSLKVTLKAEGKVSIQWDVVEETTTTAYQIQKSVNGSEFKTIAYLMGETNPTYSFRDKLNGVTGDVTYRVITTDNNVVVSTVTQNIIVF